MFRVRVSQVNRLRERGVRIRWYGLVLGQISLLWMVSMPPVLADARCLGTGGDRITLIEEGHRQYCVHEFTSVGVHSFTAPPFPESAEYLIVGGGGGGGVGGGGAGGVLTSTQDGGFAMQAGQVYPVRVGAGGQGRIGAYTPGVIPGGTWRGERGGQGEASSLAVWMAQGGGGGGAFGDQGSLWRTGGSGGSGGGGGGVHVQETSSPGGAGVTGQGFMGGYSSAEIEGAGGGGGGAGGPGQSAFGTQGGNGGPGIWSSITGVSRGYAAGGGGGSLGGPEGGLAGLPGAGGAGGGGTGGYRSTSAGVIRYGNGMDGWNQTGSGGGGVSAPGEWSGAGGDGLVVVRYAWFANPSLWSSAAGASQLRLRGSDQIPGHTVSWQTLSAGRLNGVSMATEQRPHRLRVSLEDHLGNVLPPGLRLRVEMPGLPGAVPVWLGNALEQRSGILHPAVPNGMWQDQEIRLSLEIHDLALVRAQHTDVLLHFQLQP